jgi:hypothetical protein
VAALFHVCSHFIPIPLSFLEKHIDAHATLAPNALKEVSFQRIYVLMWLLSNFLIVAQGRMKIVV